MGEYEQMEKSKVDPNPQLRLVAFISVVFSTVAVTACLLTFPLVFNYVQTLQATVQGEVETCRARSRDMWAQMLSIHQGNPGQGPETPMNAFMRATRQTHTEVGACCTCQRGPSGGAGDPGADGHDGAPGRDGEKGGPGKDAGKDEHFVPAPPQCDCAGKPGPAGPPGPNGQAGPAGDNGRAGGDGQPGGAGPPGPTGPAGANGNAGAPGPAGPAGTLSPGGKGAPGNAGAPGKAGSPGNAGNPGGPGKDGGPGGPGPAGDVGAGGKNGNAGGPGAAGDPGKNGAPGECTHCPPARLAPGY